MWYGLFESPVIFGMHLQRIILILKNSKFTTKLSSSRQMVINKTALSTISSLENEVKKQMLQWTLTPKVTKPKNQQPAGWTWIKSCPPLALSICQVTIHRTRSSIFVLVFAGNGETSIALIVGWRHVYLLTTIVGLMKQCLYQRPKAVSF